LGFVLDKAGCSSPIRVLASLQGPFSREAADDIERSKLRVAPRLNPQAKPENVQAYPATKFSFAYSLCGSGIFLIAARTHC
jgi:hypothetical protein